MRPRLNCQYEKIKMCMECASIHWNVLVYTGHCTHGCSPWLYQPPFKKRRVDQMETMRNGKPLCPRSGLALEDAKTPSSLVA
jgi:hypothetical protein